MKELVEASEQRGPGAGPHLPAHEADPRGEHQDRVRHLRVVLPQRQGHHVPGAAQSRGLHPQADLRHELHELRARHVEVARRAHEGALLRSSN